MTVSDPDPRLRFATETNRPPVQPIRTALKPPPAPEFAPRFATDLDRGVPVDHRARWLAQLARTRYALEQARFVLLRDGWTSGAWFSVATRTGEVRRVSTYESFGLLSAHAGVAHGCLVGTLLRMADDPDQAPTAHDVWHCVDELYEAMHESLGHTSQPAGRAYAHDERRARLRGLTAWNDERGRTREQVVDLVDRAIARTIVASCA